MSEEKDSKPQTIAEEAGLPDNWVPVPVEDTKPLVPGANSGGAPVQGPQGFKSTSDMPPYFSGSINPDMAHDSDYVRSQIASPAVPTVPLMPIAPSGKPQHNAAITSIVKSTVTTVPDVDPFLHFVAAWQSFISYAINDVVTWNGSVYTAITTSVGLRPDQNPSAWTILGENFNFRGRWTAGSSVKQFWANSNAANSKQVVMQTGQTQNINNQNYTFQNIQPGSAIIIFVKQLSTNATAATVTDTLGNTYTLMTQSPTENSVFWTAMYVAFNSPGGADTITVTFNGSFVSGNIYMAFMLEVAGLMSTDATANVGGFAFSGALPSLTLSTSTIGEFTVNGFGGNNTTSSPPTGYSSAQATFGSTDSELGIAWRTELAAGNSTIQWSGSFSSFGVMGSCAASFFLTPNYFPFDVVGYHGSIWVCIKATSSAPSAGSSFWALLGPGTGFVSSQSGNYTAVANDAGYLLSFNSSSAVTLTLPNPAPAPPAGASETGWFILVENIGTGTLTISNNTLTIDGVAGNLTLGQNQGVMIFADPTGNYETFHGVNSLAMPNIFTVTAPNGSGQVTVGLATESANTLFSGPTCGTASTPAFREFDTGPTFQCSSRSNTTFQWLV